MDSIDHLKYEEIQRYADEEEYSSQGLIWFEKINRHMNCCEICKNKLHQYLLVSTILENFDLELMEQVSERYKIEGVIERVKQASKGVLNVNLKDLLQGIEEGVINCFSFTASRYPALGIARGLEDSGNSDWVEWKENKMIIHSQGSPLQYYVIDVEGQEEDKDSFQSVIVQADETGEMSATFESALQTKKYTVRIFKAMQRK